VAFSRNGTAVAPTSGFGRIAKQYAAPPRPAPAPARPYGEHVAARWGVGPSFLAGGGAWSGFLGLLAGGGGSRDGETREHRTAYGAMLRGEPSVKAAVLKTVREVSGLDVTVISADKKNPRDKEIADGWRDALLMAGAPGPKVGVPHIVSNVGLPAYRDGYSVCDYALREQVEDRGRWRGKRMVRSFKAKAPGTYDLDIDQFLNVRGVWCDSPAAPPGRGREREYRPADTIVHYAYFALYADPMGTSDLQAAYRAYVCIRAATELRLLFLDRFTGGTLVASDVPDAKLALVEAALKEGRANAYLALPPGVKLDVVNIATGSEMSFKSAVEDWNREILIAVGGSHLPFQEGQTAGGRGDTGVQDKNTELKSWELAADIGGLLTWACRRWVDENYAGADYPRATKLGGIDPNAVLAEMKVAQALHDMGEALSRTELHERANWSAPDEADPKDVLPGAPPKSAAPPPGTPGGVPGPPGAGLAEAAGGGWTLEVVGE
jgi:hypothetical protein